MYIFIFGHTHRSMCVHDKEIQRSCTSPKCSTDTKVFTLGFDVVNVVVTFIYFVFPFFNAFFPFVQYFIHIFLQFCSIHSLWHTIGERAHIKLTGETTGPHNFITNKHKERMLLCQQLSIRSSYVMTMNSDCLNVYALFSGFISKRFTVRRRTFEELLTVQLHDIVNGVWHKQSMHSMLPFNCVRVFGALTAHSSQNNTEHAIVHTNILFVMFFKTWASIQPIDVFH